MAPYGVVRAWLVVLMVLTVACSSPSDPSPSAFEGERDTSVPVTLKTTLTISSTTTTGTPTTTTTTTIAPNAAPATPEEVVERLTRVEEALRGGADSSAALELGHEQQTLISALRRNDDWVPAVLDALPGDAARIEALLSAGRSSADSLPPPLEEIPAWTVRDPLPAAELRALYAEAEETYGVGWQWLAAINLVETRMGRIQGASSAGAQGPMQFLPSTWEEFGEGGDINDDRDAILAAARYLVFHGAPDEMANALFRYNPSDAYVDAVTTYAEIMAADAWTYDGFHGWRVYVRTTEGTLWVPAGYSATEPVPVEEFLSSTLETTS